ncbi:hypothetical protein DFH09DRAFT_1368964 [Mycena vulgaris]|nr:hypothetical protein DFH09DRAFT_1368964 [Mycena vulgaris]
MTDVQQQSADSSHSSDRPYKSKSNPSRIHPVQHPHFKPQPTMFKLLCITAYIAVQLSGVAAIPEPESATPSVLESRDIFSFYFTQNQLENEANIFADQTFSNSDGVAKLQVIANHIKNCSDALDSATIQLASLIRPGQSLPLLSPADGPELNTTFLPITQHSILSTLHTLLISKAFFEAVNGSPQMRIVLCHWTGELARQNDAFLSLLVTSAPSAAFATSWTQLRNAATTGFNEFLGDLNGFRCGGL